MLSNERVLEIIQKSNPGELEQIQVIVKYVFDKTKEDISNVPINMPQDQGQQVLMRMMFSISKQYYQNGM